MEHTMQNGGGLQIDDTRRKIVKGFSNRASNRLKIIEDATVDKATIQKAPEIDPYRELELYLAKVNDEIGDIIESAPSTPLNIIDQPKYSRRKSSLRLSDCRNDLIATTPLSKSNGCTFRRQNSFGRPCKDLVQGDWSDDILAEFNTIIANEINELTKVNSKTALERCKTKETSDRIVQYKELLNEFGIADNEVNVSNATTSQLNQDANYFHECLPRSRSNFCKSEQNEYSLSSDYDEPRDCVIPKDIRRKSGSLPDNLQILKGRFYALDSSDYEEPSNFSSSNQQVGNVESFRISSSLPLKLESMLDSKEASRLDCLKCANEEPKNTLGLSKDFKVGINEDTQDKSVASRRRVYEKGLMFSAKLPPRSRPDASRKNSLPISLNSQKRNKSPHTRLQRIRRDTDERDSVDPDYDDVFVPNYQKNSVSACRSRSLENHVAKSAPVTPTEDKKPPFSKLLRKKLSPVYHENSNDVVLVRVSSLPDQDLFYMDENLRCSFAKNTHSLPKDTFPKKRAISPLTLRSDISAKRLSESDKDVRQISPIDLKKFSLGSRSHSNDVAVHCDLSEDPRFPSINGATDINRFHRIENNVKRTLQEQHGARSGSLPISLQSLLSRIRNGSGSCCPNSPPIESLAFADVATQTSPALSRSSSFTWISDCESPRAGSRTDGQFLQDESTLDPESPQDTVDDDNRSSSSSQDLLQSMDEISSGSLSPDRTDRASPLESGIGTASPPRSTDRRSLKPSTLNKCHRKETWERIRRNPSILNTPTDKTFQDVWIKRESVHTQTMKENDNQYCDLVDSSSGGLDASLPRKKICRPNNLPLSLSITASSSLSSGELLETPPRAPSSPSTGSLQLKPEPLLVEMGGKSNSAPLLENNGTEQNGRKTPNLQQPRSQSERQLSEIEAQEACKWLRAAGFPQYAQMYEDYQFPIDVSGVEKDHPFLETDSLQSLFRRLHALNRCANMKLDTHHHHTHHHNTSHGKSGGGEDSDEDTQCALSENWTFEKKTRRWSRIVDVTQANIERLQGLAGQNASEEESLEDRLEAEEAEDTMLENVKYGSLPPGTLPEEIGPRFRRTGSERLRDGAKAFLRRVESLKSRRRKRHNRDRDGVVISGPQVLDVASMQQKMKELNCVDVSPTVTAAPVSFGELLPSPLHQHLPQSPSPFTNSPSPFGDDSSSYCSDGSQGGSVATTTPTRTKMNRARRLLHRNREDQGALSDSECQPTSWRHRYFRDANSNHAKVLEYIVAHPAQSPKDSTVSKLATPSSPLASPINTRGGSLNLGKESQRFRDKLTHNQDFMREDRASKSFRHTRSGDAKLEDQRGTVSVGGGGKPLLKDVTIYREKSRSRSSELAGSQESSSTAASKDSDQEEDSPRHKGTVVRWHSFQRGSLYPEPQDHPLCPRAMASMSCGQLLVLRKLALLKLTACMERYCPTHRTGWNWELPKFIRKIKTPDYKDKTVFGVPLLLSLQRTGQALPKCIQIALRWLRANALDQVGIFRKSGVRSRIQKLKVMTETQGDNINFDGQQAFDVADLVKQYFRELPEALLTNKLSETFTAIFQHVPVELRPDAVQCVLLLLPDEHREALETMLDFLNHVATNSPYNQMTASNLAVCLAPSLFHFNHTNTSVSNRSNSVSPRRRKTVGIPDQRELSENKAAHDCLLYLIKMHRELFMISSDMLTQCHFNYMEESIPVALEELGSELKQDWRGYLYACTTALLKEAREKSRGWVSINNPADNSVEMAYKKVGDGHPLRLWRVSTEVEAPPNELLHRVLRERHIWDPQLLKYRQVNKLDTNVEVFQYATGNMAPLPARDYCVLRSWRNDLPKGACVIVETSVEHPGAPVMLGGTRGIVLASRYLIEPCGSGKSRIMHLSRVDTKGRTPEWYNKSYGHIVALHLSKIRNSFKHTTDGPESKV